MALIHVLENSDPGGCRCVLHAAVPTGQNAAGFAWKEILLLTGQTRTSCLTEGTGPSQITAAELAQIVAGDVIELSTMIQFESCGGSAASVRKLAAKALKQHKETLADRYKYYGATQEN